MAEFLRIDRGKPFDPVGFLTLPDRGAGWKIAEQDERSLALTKIDMSKVRLESMLERGESVVIGGKKLERLKTAGYIRLDAAMLQALLKEPRLIPREWKKRQAVSFDGTILLDRKGRRYVLCLYHGDSGYWGCYPYWLNNVWSARGPSAVLADAVR